MLPNISGGFVNRGGFLKRLQTPNKMPSVRFPVNSIHFLHRPARDWVIDRLITRAEGVVRSEPIPL